MLPVALDCRATRFDWRRGYLLHHRIYPCKVLVDVYAVYKYIIIPYRRQTRSCGGWFNHEAGISHQTPASASAPLFSPHTADYHQFNASTFDTSTAFPIQALFSLREPPRRVRTPNHSFPLEKGYNEMRSRIYINLGVPMRHIRRYCRSKAQ